MKVHLVGKKLILVKCLLLKDFLNGDL